MQPGSIDRWRLAARLDSAQRAGARRVQIEGQRVLLLPVGSGWCALHAACAGCGGSLGLDDEIRDRALCCARCGHRHALGPDASDDGRLPTMVVDDEIFVLL